MPQGILRQDAAPSIYSYSQTFTAPSGASFERRGFIALGRVEDYSAKVVFRHEQTLSKPKADRLDLLRATRAHYEQLFLLYEDSGEIDSLLATPQAPTIDVADEYGVAHRVWQISDPDVIAAVQDRMRDKSWSSPTAITATKPRSISAMNPALRPARLSNPQAPYEFVMMTFVNMNDPGLLVLPTHRVVHSLESFSADEFQNSARAFFEVEEVDPALDAARATALLHDRGRAGTALLAVTANRAFLLHSPKAAGAHILCRPFRPPAIPRCRATAQMFARGSAAAFGRIHSQPAESFLSARGLRGPESGSRTNAPAKPQPTSPS